MSEVEGVSDGHGRRWGSTAAADGKGGGGGMDGSEREEGKFFLF